MGVCWYTSIRMLGMQQYLFGYLLFKLHKRSYRPQSPNDKDPKPAYAAHPRQNARFTMISVIWVVIAMTIGETRGIIQVGLLQQKPRCYKPLAPRAVIISSIIKVTQPTYDTIRRGPSILWQAELFTTSRISLFCSLLPLLSMMIWNICASTQLQSVLENLRRQTKVFEKQKERLLPDFDNPPPAPRLLAIQSLMHIIHPPQYYFNSGCSNGTRLMHYRSLETIQCIRFTTSWRHIELEHLSPNFVWPVRYAQIIYYRYHERVLLLDTDVLFYQR